MDAKDEKHLRETFEHTPVNRLIDEMYLLTTKLDEVIKNIGLGGKLHDDLLKLEIIMDEVYSRFFARHHIRIEGFQ